jgi:predicted PurR-regulated permease PerM
MEPETLETKPASGPGNENKEPAKSSRSRLRLAELLQSTLNIRSIALTGLFILAVFYTMYFVRATLLPLVLAVLLSYLLRPITRALARIKIPPSIGSAIVLASVVGIVGYSAFNLAAPVGGWLEKAPYSLPRLQAKLLPLKHPIEKVAQASGEIEKLATPSDTQKTPAVEVKEHSIPTMLAMRTPEFVASALLLVALLYFLLAYDGVFLAKLIRLLPTFSDKRRAVSIAAEIESQISRYLLAVTLINIGLGVAVGIAVGLLGLPNPMMWGAMVAVLNFVPYLGALTGIVCITLGALLSFDSLSYALLFPGVYLGFATLEANFITPWVMGRSLTLNPVMILLSLAFWGWLWGIPGVILAVPLLAAFKIFCAHVETMEPLAEFLS